MNVVLSPSFKSSLSCNHQTGTCLGSVRTSVDKIHITKHLRGILNAWRFQFKVQLKCLWHNGLVLGGLRCSPLNAALGAKERFLDLQS